MKHWTIPFYNKSRHQICKNYYNPTPSASQPEYNYDIQFRHWHAAKYKVIISGLIIVAVILAAKGENESSYTVKGARKNT